MARRKRKKRGFLLTSLINFEEQAIHAYKVFTETVKSLKRIILPRKWKNASEKQRYHYYEEVVNLIRFLRDEGLKSMLLAEPQKAEYVEEFLDHLKKHHRWLIRPKGHNQIVMKKLKAQARNLKEVKNLLAQEDIQELIKKMISEESYLLMKHLEKSINIDNPKSLIIYGLKEIEIFIYKGGKKDVSAGKKVDYLLFTDEFWESHEQKNRVHRLLQISQNKGIIIRMLPEESSAGNRIKQFGGIVIFKKMSYYD